MVQKVWLLWEKTTFLWDKLNLNWDEAFLLIEIAQGGGGSGGLLVDADKVWKTVDQDLKKRGYDEEERKKFLKIVLKVNGITVDSTRKLDSVKKEITVEHIKNTIAQVTPDVRIQVVQVKKEHE